MIKRFSIVLAAMLLATVGLIAQQKALEPSAERLKKDVSYLASDALEGRQTGTKGADDAARYIAEEFTRVGLRRSLQSFPYVSGIQLGKKNWFSAIVTDAALSPAIGKDWMPLSFSANKHVEAFPPVIVGYGITASDLNYNDYANVEVARRVAIAFSGTPDGDNPHGQFARYDDVRWKAIAARNAGAEALIVVAREEDFSRDKLSRLRHDHTGEVGIPVIAISRQTAETLLGQPISDLEARAKSKAPAYPDLVWYTNLTVDIERSNVAAYNVIGVLEGSDPVLKNENIVIGAHYDHLGHGGEGSGSMVPDSRDIHHGADDNASGTAGLIELARIFAAQRPKLKRTVIFIAFAGEEEGLLGSNYYVNHPLVPLTNTVAMINMDMIGRMRDRKLAIGGVGTAPEWRQVIGKETPLELSLSEDGLGPSDHSSFYLKQIPVLFFFTGPHNDYHKPSDTFEKINYDDEARILSLVARIVRDIDGAEKRLTFTATKSEPGPRTGGFRVYLGTIPNYADSTNGLLLDGVRDDSPAAKAGLKAGDRVVKIGTQEIRNVQDYTYALGEMKAGQEYVFEVLRGTERLTLKVIPAVRK
ncbi:MAG TPA: M20/M25/M40 family metallo-hydrolase [Pyrinomonadaceae bacterium]